MACVWHYINIIYFSGVIVSIFYGLLTLIESDDKTGWDDIGIVLIMSLLFSWSSALAFFVGFNKNNV